MLPLVAHTLSVGRLAPCPLFRGLIYFWGAIMNRFVVMVDAGYLLTQSLSIISSRQGKKRTSLEVTDPKGLIGLLLQKSRSILDLQGKELLRVYWYDGMLANGLTTQQKALVDVDDVQFRGGTVNGKGQQKGVDSLIVTDLIELTSHHAICDAVLVTGDSDLAVGIELAQRRGVRIGVLGVEDLAVGVQHQQSFEITSRADRVGYVGGAELRPFMTYLVPAATQNSQASGAASQVISTASSQSPTPTGQSPAQAAAAPPTAPTASAKTAKHGVQPSDYALIAEAVAGFIAQS